MTRKEFHHYMGKAVRFLVLMLTITVLLHTLLIVEIRGMVTVVNPGFSYGVTNHLGVATLFLPILLKGKSKEIDASDFGEGPLLHNCQIKTSL